MRIRPALSDLSLDLLVRRRQAGEQLSSDAAMLLDRLRPDGPLRKSTRLLER